MRSRTCVKGTPPNCADPFSLSLKLKRSESSLSPLVAAACKLGHDCLPYLFSSNRHSCDCCSAIIRAGSQGWRCFDCNHDVCHCCHPSAPDEVDPESIISCQSVNGLCNNAWTTVVVHACASQNRSPQLALQASAEPPNAVYAHFSLIGRDAEGWAGHHGTAFAQPTVSYLSLVIHSSAKHSLHSHNCSS